MVFEFAAVIGLEMADGKRGHVEKALQKIGSGITNYSATELQSIKGAHSEEISSLLGYISGSEVIHRNNLVLM